MRKISVVLLASFLFQAPVHAADRIRIGFPDITGPFVPLPIGQKMGFFQEEGLQPEILRINPATAIQALVSGEIDYYTVIGPAVAAAVREVPIKVVGCYTFASTVTLIARPEFKSIQELKGKTIGVNNYGGALESTARLIFKHFGLDPNKEIKILATGGIEARFAALKQGLTAAMMGSPPADFVAKKMGFVILAKAQELFNYPVSGLVTSVKKIKEKPDEIKRVLEAGIKTDHYIHSNRNGTIQVMEAWMKIDKEMAAATYDSFDKVYSDDLSLPGDGLRLLIDEAKRATKVEREISLTEVMDLSMLAQAQREFAMKTK